jgi:hypothetical protein
MSDNLKLWDAVKTPPLSSLKTIRGGRLNGMTDISPMWRYSAATEQFGPCGVGWKFEIVRTWTDEGADGEITANAQVNLYFKHEGAWSEAIPGVGGSALTKMEKSGLHTSDECYKMAITDALSTSMKMLGFGADIYMGKFDGTKYKDEVKPTGPSDTQKMINKVQFEERLKQAELKFDEKNMGATFLKYLEDTYGTNNISQIAKERYKGADAIIESLMELYKKGKK